MGIYLCSVVRLKEMLRGTLFGLHKAFRIWQIPRRIFRVLIYETSAVQAVNQNHSRFAVFVGDPGCLTLARWA